MSRTKLFTRGTSMFLATLVILSCLLCGCASYSRDLTDGTAIENYSGTPSSTGKPTQTIEGYTGVATNENFSMYVDETNLDILLVNNKTGVEWHSIPAGWEEDEYAKGATKQYIPSALLLEIFDHNGQISTISSYNECVRKGENFKVTFNKDGFRVDYFFEKYEIKISICYYLTDKGFYITIPNDSIVDDVDIITTKKDKGKEIEVVNNYRLSKFSVHPYFNAAALGTEGYMFVPEGSGALINYIQTPSTQSQQSSVVYGFDNAIEIPSMPMPTTQYYLPVFGMNNTDNGFVAVIGNDGDYLSRIVSGVAGQSAGYYRNFAKLTYRDTHTVTLYKGQSNERYLNDISTVGASCDYYIEYMLLGADECDYVGMANAYREYLIDTKQMKDNEIGGVTMNVSLLGAIRKKTSILGVPVEVTDDFTTYEQAVEILKALKEKGVEDINLIYRGANSGGYMYEKLGDFSPVGVLGGKSAFNKLVDYVSTSGVSMTIESELIDVYRNGGAFSKSKDSVRQLDDAYLLQKTWNPITLTEKNSTDRYYLLAPSSLLKMSKLLNSSVPEDVNISVSKVGTKVYSQFKSSDFTPRDMAGQYWEQTLAMLAANNDNVTVNGGNAYVLPYATMLIDIPDSAGLTDMESEEVPFYQMVVHGYVPYSFGEGNLRANNTKDFLKMVEYGAMPYWEWGAKESSVLKDTQYNYNYSAYYLDWLEEAANEYVKIKDLYEDIADEVMVAHEKLAENVYKTTYANGVAVIVNYGDAAYTADGVTVNALDFAVTGRGE